MSAKMTIELRSNIPALAAAVRAELGLEVEALAGDIRDRAVKAIRADPKTGRVYGAERAVAFTSGKGTDKEQDVAFTAHKGRKLGDDKVHQASAPGEAPASDEGNLAGTIEIERTGPLSADVTVPADYAATLEFGTVKAGVKHETTIEPRPFLAPAVEAVRPAFEALVALAVKKGAGG